jgi:transcriptional regulator with XRE-family HTH domain
MIHYDFGIIRSLRKKQNLTIAQLAERSGRTYPTLGAIEKNKSVPSLLSLDQIAAALGVQTASLVLLSQRCEALKACSVPVEGVVLPKDMPSVTCRSACFGDIKIYRLRAQAGIFTDKNCPHSDVFEVVYVLEGIVELILYKNFHRLQPDETFFFDGQIGHFYRYVQSGEILVLHIPKNISALHNLFKPDPPASA